MKLFTSKIQKEWDEYTMQHEPISSEKLMYRAASSIFISMVKKLNPDTKIVVLCGSGNNGGDGLVIAKLLRDAFFKVEVWYFPVSTPSPENKYYRDILLGVEEVKIVEISPGNVLPASFSGDIFIDAIMGFGFRGPWKNGWDTTINALNQLPNYKIAIDLPSGMDENCNTPEAIILKANFTYTIQSPKKCFFYESGHKYTGPWEIIPIGLDKKFYQEQKTSYATIDHATAAGIFKPKKWFSSKWHHGHAALIAGNQSMPGAAILAAEACLRSGVGLLTSWIPECISNMMSNRIPECILQHSGEDFWYENIHLDESYSSAGIGPGLGRNSQTSNQLLAFLNKYKDLPKVLDADALNILSDVKQPWSTLTEFAVLTPHIKESKRLFGTFSNMQALESLVINKAEKYNMVIVLKGAYSRVCCPDGVVYYNTTGNPGMAKGGFGDVLTGLITGLLAQEYSPTDATLLGVYIHGLAGDMAKKEKGEMAMLPRDLITCLPNAWKTLEESAP